ncbi:MAG: outer membrane lipoprotein chaperone LolA [Betaproteobacteria bacterium]|nr:MAG: outer membrane lipoprotein chaperone LolA [Betaproteobacteria bacterium]
MRGLRLALLAALLAATGAQAAALERFRVYVRTTQSARADFEQQVVDRNGKRVQDSKGSFLFLRPGRFRWSYAKPYPQLIVGDGERVWIHDPDLNQVTVRKVARAIGSTPAALLAGAAEIEKAFELQEAGTKDGLEWLDAKPRERDAGFERVRLGLGVSGVEAMELVDQFGQTTLLRFSNIVRNPKLAGTEFRFTPPPGADVLGEK